jgi:hypothetical protein
MSNISLLTKPAQSGKTATLLNEFAISYDEKLINLIFVDNSKLQANQLKTRIETHCGLEQYESSNGNKCLVLTSETKINIDTVFRKICRENYKIIIMCSHCERIKQADELIKDLTNYNFKIIIDEADKNLKLFDEKISEWKTAKNIFNIELITATPDKIINKFSDIKIIQNKTSYDEDIYHSFSECDFLLLRVEGDNTKYHDYIETVIEHYKEKIENGQVWFIPGETNVDSHNKIKDVLKTYGFCVFVINGDKKKLYYEDKIFEIPCSDNDSIGEIIGKMYQSHNLINKKIAITGNKCINRGITIHSKNMLITHAIFPTKSTNEDNDYQLAGRICGNIKKFKKYKKPFVICGKHFKNAVESKEMNVSTINNANLTADAELSNIKSVVITKTIMYK